MKYNRFEDLLVWNAAQDVAVDVFALVEDRAFNQKGGLRDQLQRASLSISNNIAEGFERGSTAELLCFLYIARGSAGETRSSLRFCLKLAERGVLKSEISDSRSEISNLIPHCESVSRQLRAWADSFQDSDIKGQRHLNDASRTAYDQANRTRAFMDKLRRLRAGEQPDVSDPVDPIWNGSDPGCEISDLKFEISNPTRQTRHGDPHHATTPPADHPHGPALRQLPLRRHLHLPLRRR